MLLAVIPVLVMAQKKTTSPTIKKPEAKTAIPIKIITTTTTVPETPSTPSAPPLTEGKDLSITINRVDDVSSFDLNTYNVHYTVTNTGTAELNMNYAISLKGTFNTIQNAYFCSGGAMALPVNSPLLRSRETVQGVFTVNAPRLQKGVSYKFSLMIDGDNRVTEGNENNNSAETTITANAIKNSDYFLQSCKITIKTGNDNKEANNSLVYFYVGPANYNQNTFLSLGDWPKGTGYAPEMKVNSSTDILLSTAYGKSEYNSLCFYKQKGIALTIIYNNKAWASDAWKINDISLTLYFKDRNGNAYPHPAYASKTINFTNLSALLGYKFGDDISNNANQTRILTIGTDQNFNPLAPEFKKLENGRFSTLVLERSPTYKTPVTYCY